MKLDTEKALTSPLILISGDESALRRLALDQILERLEMKPDDFDLQSFEGDSEPIDWVASAGTSPFLAERRVVIVRHLLRCDPDRAKSAIKGLPATALLILLADDENGDEDRQRRLASTRKSWEKLVKDAGGQTIDCKIQTGALKDMVRSEFALAEKRITDRALDILSEMCAGSASRALEEVPKLVAYVEPEKVIQESDVREVVMPSREWNVFKLVDSVVDGDVGESLRQLRILVGTPTKAEDAAFRNILPQLTRSLRMIWQARVCADAGVQPANAPESVKASFLSKPNLMTEHEFVRGKAIRAAKRINLVQITQMLRLVSDADAQLKGQLPNFTAMETLEQTVLQMAEVARPKVAAR